jgi:hypothetical protein
MNQKQNLRNMVMRKHGQVSKPNVHTSKRLARQWVQKKILNIKLYIYERNKEKTLLQRSPESLSRNWNLVLFCFLSGKTHSPVPPCKTTAKRAKQRAAILLQPPNGSELATVFPTLTPTGKR